MSQCSSGGDSGNSHLVQSVDFLLGFEAAVQPKDPGRVAVRHVALVTFLALEEDLTLVATEQTDVMHL